MKAYDSKDDRLYLKGISLQYSKNAAFSGLGRDQVRYVPSDKLGRLDLKSLELMIEEDIQNGFKPIMVNLTAGTTVLGAFDPVGEVRAIGDKYGLWLHLDGSLLWICNF